MKFSKHVETCFVRANDDFDDKLTYIYCFLNEKYFLDKNPPKRFQKIRKYETMYRFVLKSSKLSDFKSIFSPDPRAI